MNPGSSVRFLVPLLLAAALAGCRNDGAGPAVPDDKAATLTPPGTGAGNSSTGATGGTATSPGSEAAALPGVSAGGPADATVKPERNSPDTTTTTPSR